MQAFIEGVAARLWEANAPALWLDAAIKSLVVLAATGAVCLGWRRASAATRHGLWLVAVAGLFCLPWLSLLAPARPPSLWIVSADRQPGNVCALTIEFAPGRGGAGAAAGSAAELAGGFGASASASGEGRRVTTRLEERWLTVAFGAWLAGGGLVLASLGVGHLRLWGIRRRARAVTDADWTAVLRESAEALSLRRPVLLLQSDEPVMPMTWGWWRPVIVVPVEAGQWTAERRRVVLLHEIAHVKRRDCLTGTIARIACALYWFNPLVWLAARRMCVERERACDDLVLNHGGKASDYATHLVAVARAFRPVARGAAVGIARRSGLQRRVAAILDGRRNRSRTAKAAAVFVALALFGLELLSGGNAMKNSPEVWSLERSMISDQLERFVAEKSAQASAAAAAEGTNLLPEFQSLFAAAARGDWAAVSNTFHGLRQRAPQYEGEGPKDECLSGIAWSTVLETWGAFQQFAGYGEKYFVAFGRDTIASIPPGSVYFGGTDPGRFVITAMSRSHVNGDPFFTLTQNALADNGYLKYLQSMYGRRLYIPTEADATNSFNQYLADVRQRRNENKLRPGEDVREVDGKLQVQGQVAVMTINGLLARIIFDRNPDREFYLEESFPLDWMYPHLTPHGLILKINRQPLAELPPDVIQRDREYWTRYVRPLLGGWLTEDTGVAEIAAFVAKVHVSHDLSGFEGDPAYVRNSWPQKMISKLRSSGGGVYAWRYQKASDPEERDRLRRAADFAFRQAFALCPSSPEAIFRYVNFLVTEQRLEDAIVIAETAQRFEPENPQLAMLLKELKRMAAARRN